ncbi:hypothetical protein [Priestia megaterium]|uniref:hypothetical protein n=1 Tax=Priestia megaterium TaxID=1404 RepID=UPI0011279864|nr:hypothetical protein [Priestia megaterium]TPF19029.1 hypothetical protein CBE78_07365 [Priestia megaterium]TPF23138.1 hypothetical protein CBE79_09875 [Priestia megaterium]
MKKSVLPIFFIVNLFFIYCLLFNQGYIFQLQNLPYIWAIYLLLGTCLAFYYMLRYKQKKDGQVLLSIGILTTSISSLGCLVFFYFFYHAMGG